MRTISFAVRGGQMLEVFTDPHGALPGEFEIWMVGVIKGQRAVLDHFLTHENYEKRLCYAQAGDLLWRNADETALPPLTTDVARAHEETIQRRVFWDNASLSCYNASHQFLTDRKAANAARKSLIGKWTDGEFTLELEPDGKLWLSLPPLSVPIAFEPLRHLYAAQHDDADTWHFSAWWLFLMNQAGMRGQKIGMWRCDEPELHLFTFKQDALVHVFRRA